MDTEIHPTILANAIVCTAKQGTDEWLNDRKGCITSTGIGAILGVNNFKSAEQYESDFKGTSEPVVVTEAMRLGTEYEPYIREKASKMLRKPIHELGFVKWRENPKFGCSADGYIVEDDDTITVVEIKLFTSDYHERQMFHHVANSQLGKNAHPGAYISPTYYEQIQFIAGILGASKILFVNYSLRSSSLYMQYVPVSRDHFRNVQIRAGVEFLLKCDH